MTDYHPLIARAVDGLAKNSGEARRALYERARAALVAQLRSVEPALSESDITKERLALEEAIRKVEAEAARKALAEPRSAIRSEPRVEPRPAAATAAAAAATAAVSAEASAAPPQQDDAAPQPGASQPAPRSAAPQPAAPQPAAKPTARARFLEARTTSLAREGLKGFRNVMNEVDGLGAATAKAAQTARDTRESYGPAASPSPARASLEDNFSPPPPPEPEPTEPHFDHGPDAVEHEPRELHGLEPPYNFADEPAVEQDDRPPRAVRPFSGRQAELAEAVYEEPRAPRSYGGVIRAAVLLLIVAVVAAAAFEFRSNIAGVYHLFSQMKTPAPSQTAQETAAQPKFSGRVPQEGAPGEAAAPAGSPNPQAGPAVAQRAVLYEADPNDPQGKRYPGSVVWRTETVSPGPGLAPELVVRADISIPERHMTMTWSLRRNTDKALPASHTIEVMFNLPPDFAGGGIANVPGILMKDSEEVRGMPLAGLAVKVTNGFFLIGLNAADAEMQRNIQLLKERPWFDVLIVYNNNGRAILTMEKGPPGERAFADAFKAWGQ
jgi:hypothetical protein